MTDTNNSLPDAELDAFARRCMELTVHPDALHGRSGPDEILAAVRAEMAREKEHSHGN